MENFQQKISLTEKILQQTPKDKMLRLLKKLKILKKQYLKV